MEILSKLLKVCDYFRKLGVTASTKTGLQPDQYYSVLHINRIKVNYFDC